MPLELSIRSNVVSADVTEALRQVEETYGARVASLAAALPPFQKMGALCISPHATNPLVGSASTNRGSYHAASNAYYISPEINYVEFASSDWSTRLSAYARAVEEAVSRVPQTRLENEERSLLLASVKQALADVAANAPHRVAVVGTVYIGIGGGTGPIFAYEPHPGMTPVGLEDIPHHAPARAQQKESLFKLYQKVGGVLRYREGWISNELTVVEHRGLCGQRGEMREHASETAGHAQKAYAQLKRAALDEGFHAISQSKHAKLVVEFPIDQMGSRSDLDRRHALEDFLEDLVGWLGLGHLDGGSTGSDTMEAMCYVVDFQIAKIAVEQALRSSSFSNFGRVYREK